MQYYTDGEGGKPMQYDKADQQNCPRRVVFYGRVSTELEAQISALKNQMNWYLELAEHHTGGWWLGNTPMKESQVLA